MKKPLKPSVAPLKPEPVSARLLHDGLCQTLTGIHLFATVLTRRVRKADRKLGKEMDELYALIERARNECHVLLEKLRGPARQKNARKSRSQTTAAR